MERFEGPILIGLFAIVAVGFACLAWAVLVAAYRGTLLLKARELFRSGHIQEAAAFRISATPGASKSGSIRKAILATVQAKAAHADPHT